MRRFRAAVAIMSALGILFGQVGPAGAVTTASSSTWYWQNPLPHPVSVNAIACPSVTRCVAVGDLGSILRTNDAGRHWSSGNVGSNLRIHAVSCPSSTVCYALGDPFLGNSCCVSDLLRSVDGGATWQQTPLSGLTYPHAITCPGATTCLVEVNDNPGGQNLLRTTDGGQTWAQVLQGARTVSCPSSRVCYAGVDLSDPAAQSPWPWTHAVYRSEDGGMTWRQWWASAQDGGAGIEQLACSRTGRCLVGLVPRVFGDAALLLVQKDGNASTGIDHGAPHRLSSVTCLDGTACVVFGGKVTQSADGGKTWTTRPLSLIVNGPVVCPASRTCYAPAVFTLIKTSDSFTHTGETPAKSPIGRAFLDSIQCPTRDTCYAYGRGSSATSLVATGNGGHTWSIRPDLPLGYAIITCPSSTVCYARGTVPHSTQWALDRTRDGARTWQTILTRPENVLFTGLSCPTAETCYVGVQLHNAVTKTPTGYMTSPRFALLVTHNGGVTWTVNRGIDRVPGHAAAHPGCFGACDNSWSTPGSPACPSAMTCFETVPTWREGDSGWLTGTVIAVTKDGGNSWTVTGQCGEAAVGGPQDICSSPTCPTVTSCYMPGLAPVAGTSPSGSLQLQVMVTHNGGATWHSAALGTGAYPTVISCAGAKACHALTSAGLFVTADGGKTWQQQAAPPSGISGLACPGANTCYAVSGINILSTRPR